MQYEPIKKSLGGFFSLSPFLRKILYLFLDLLLLRAWHVKKSIREFGSSLPYNANVLDAGSGLGQYTWRMSSMHKGWNIKAVDINEELIKACNAFITRTGRSERVKFEICDLTALKDNDYYDFIITIDVMEHIKEDEQVFANYYKALKDKGILLISTPSDKGGSDVHNDDDNSFIYEHVRAGYSKEEISFKLKSAGFKTVHSNYTYGKAGNLAWILSMKYPVRMLNKSFLFFIILPFYYIIVFPVSFFLNIIDLKFISESGTGLLVKAEK